MYSWIFRRLPGPLWVRILLTAVLLAGAVVILFELVFPWVAQLAPLDQGITVARA